MRNQVSLVSEDRKGLECPRCGCRLFYTIWTRNRDGLVARARRCRACNRQIITEERIRPNSTGGTNFPL